MSSWGGQRSFEILQIKERQQINYGCTIEKIHLLPNAAKSESQFWQVTRCLYYETSVMFGKWTNCFVSYCLSKRVKVTGNNEDNSLLHHIIIYGRNNFFNTGPGEKNLPSTRF
jgi:hypothetical protein